MEIAELLFIFAVVVIAALTIQLVAGVSRAMAVSGQQSQGVSHELFAKLFGHGKQD